MSLSENTNLSTIQPPAKTVIIGAGGRMGKMLIEKTSEKGIKTSALERPIVKMT